MGSDEEKREITVKAPSKPVISPEEKARKSTERALEEERFGVLQFPKRVNRYFGFMVVVTGVILLSLFAYMAATGLTEGLLLSSETSSTGLVIWGFVGLVNIVIGFLFLGRD